MTLRDRRVPGAGGGSPSIKTPSPQLSPSIGLYSEKLTCFTPGISASVVAQLPIERFQLVGLVARHLRIDVERCNGWRYRSRSPGAAYCSGSGSAILPHIAGRRESAACNTTRDFCAHSLAAPWSDSHRAGIHRIRPARSSRREQLRKELLSATKPPNAKPSTGSEGVAWIGHVLLLESKIQNHPRARKGDDNSGNPAEHGEHDAFRQRLPDQPGSAGRPAPSAPMSAVCVSSPAPASGWRDWRRQSAVQTPRPTSTGAGLPDTGLSSSAPIAAMREVQRLLRHQRLVAFLHFAQRARQKLTQLHLHLRFHRGRVRARINAADQIQPLQAMLHPASCSSAKSVAPYGSAGRTAGGLLCTRSPKKPGGVMPNHREGLAVNHKRLRRSPTDHCRTSPARCESSSLPPPEHSWSRRRGRWSAPCMEECRRSGSNCRRQIRSYKTPKACRCHCAAPRSGVCPA